MAHYAHVIVSVGFMFLFWSATPPPDGYYVGNNSPDSCNVGSAEIVMLVSPDGFICCCSI